MNASHIITQATHYKTRFVMNRVVFIWAIMNLPKCLYFPGLKTVMDGEIDHSGRSSNHSAMM